MEKGADWRNTFPKPMSTPPTIASRRLRRIRLLAITILVLSASPSLAAAQGEEEVVASVVFSLGVVLLAAKFGGDLAMRAKQPAVLGELLIGVVVGNLPIIGFDGLAYLASDPNIGLLASLGVLVLLFEVGLESTVREMLEVGLSALLVALIGVGAPFALGWLVGIWLLPDESAYVHAFLGAALSATSVGITARVLQDLRRGHTVEARIILGAAVIDDVLGLVILAVVAGIIRAAEAGGTLALSSIVWILAKAIIFLVGSLALGLYLSPRLFHLASRLQGRGILIAVGLSFCFLMAWLASLIELAPIVGAFAAGLILENVHYRDFIQRGEHPLDELIQPVSAFLAPIFFVVMGLRTDLRSFAMPGTLGLALALTLAGIIGKQLCSLGVIGRGIDRLSVGIGMIPRGEVGLIFANVGATLTYHGHPIIEASTYSAIVVVVILTTLITPPALRFSLRRERG